MKYFGNKSNIRKSILLYFLVLVFFITILLDGVAVSISSASGINKWDGSTAKSFNSGKGTKDKPYILSKGSQLKLLSKMTNAGKTYEGIYFELGADLDMSADQWIAIGNTTNPFKGYFNGKDYSIYNLNTITRTLTGSDNCQGLFGCIINGTVKNTRVINPYIVSDSFSASYVGGISGYIKDSTITNCIIEGGEIHGGNVGGIAGYGINAEIKDSNNSSTICNLDYYAGGIIGYTDNATIKNCYNEGDIMSKNVDLSYFYPYSGGIAGLSLKGSIEHCYNTGNIYSSDNPTLGGIVGQLGNRNNKGGSVRNCYNTGNISGNNLVGGIAGMVYGQAIIDCYNTGNISGNQQVGGIAGYAFDEEIFRCYNTGKVTGKRQTGGIAGFLYVIKISNCYNIGEIIGGDMVGGIAGEMGTPGTKVYLMSCYNKGKVTGNSNIGGISGESNVPISKSGNYGHISGDKNKYIGGIVGEANESISDCFNSGEVTNGAGIAGYSSTISNSYNYGKADLAGIVNYNGGTVTNCYFDIDSADTGIANGESGKASPEMKSDMKTSQFANKLISEIWTYDKDHNSGFPIPHTMVTNPIRPIKFEVTGGNKQITLSWNEIDNVNYVIYRYNSKTKKYESIKSITKASTTSFIDKGLKNGETYQYRMRAYRKLSGTKWYSLYTLVKSAKPSAKAASTTPTITPKSAKPTPTPDQAKRDLKGINIVVGDWWSTGNEKISTTKQEDEQKYRDNLQKQHNFTLKRKNLGTYSDYLDIFITSSTAKNPVADIFYLDQSMIAEPLKQGLLYPVSDLPGFNSFKDDHWNKSITDTFKQDKKTYIFSNEPNEPGLGVFYNKRLLEEAGLDPDLPYDLQGRGEWTWEKFIEIAGKLTRDTNYDGVPDTYGIGCWNTELVKAAIFSNGSDYLKYNKSTGRYESNLMSEEVIQAIELAKTLNDKGFLMPRPDGTNWDWYVYSFIDGETAMVPTEWFRHGSFANMYDDWGFVFFPKGPSENAKLNTTYTGTVMVMPASIDEKRADDVAFAYNKWVTTVPGYKNSVDETLWNYYPRTRDTRAVEETIKPMLEGSGTYSLQYLIPGISTVYWADENDKYGISKGNAQEIATHATSIYDELISDFYKE